VIFTFAVSDARLVKGIAPITHLHSVGHIDVRIEQISAVYDYYRKSYKLESFPSLT